MIEVTNGALYFDSGIPSNFFGGAPIVLSVAYFMGKEWTFPTNEHYFQAMKACLIDDPALFREIVDAPTPHEAKQLGRSCWFGPEEREAWDSGAALIAMLECNVAKYTQHEACRYWLKGTGNLRLIEHRRDAIWGDGLDGSGRNLLGGTLELVRALLR